MLNTGTHQSVNCAKHTTSSCTNRHIQNLDRVHILGRVQISLLIFYLFLWNSLLASGCICLLNIAPNFLLFLYPFVLAILLLGCLDLVFLIPWCLSKKKKTASQREAPSVLHLESLQASAALVGYTKAERGVKKLEKLPFYSSLTWKYFIRFCCRSNCSVFMQCFIVERCYEL